MASFSISFSALALFRLGTGRRLHRKTSSVSFAKNLTCKDSPAAASHLYPAFFTMKVILIPSGWRRNRSSEIPEALDFPDSLKSRHFLDFRGFLLKTGFFRD